MSADQYAGRRAAQPDKPQRKGDNLALSREDTDILPGIFDKVLSTLGYAAMKVKRVRVRYHDLADHNNHPTRVRGNGFDCLRRKF